MGKFRFVILGIVILALSIWAYEGFINSNEKKKRVLTKVEKTVFTEVVQNSEIPIVIKEKGSLRSKDRVVLYSEVQGVLENSKKEFRVGVAFKKGETLLAINSDEHIATLKAQKSIFQNLIVSIMPDLRMDYPDSFEKWVNYLNNFDVDKRIKDIPEPSSDKEKYFITAKDIYTTYYNIKNLEVRLEKYNLKAPFDGVITEVNVNEGALVRQGQIMGEFINTDTYELTLSVNASLANDIRIGKKVELTDLTETIKVTGKVVRIGGKIDLSSQTLDVFIEVNGKNLREGIYLEAEVTARGVPNSYEIPRNLLIKKEHVFVFQDSIIKRIPVTPIYYKRNSVIVKGIPDGTDLLAKPVLGAFDGMPAKKYNTSKE